MDNKSKNIFFITFGTLIVVIFGLVMFHELKHGDFPAHIAFAREFAANGYLYKIPHTLFARFVVIIRALLPANIAVWVSPYAKQVFDIKSFEISTVILMTLTYLASAFVIMKRLLRDWDLKEKPLYCFAGFITIVILMAAPIFFFTFPDRMFLGYIMGNRYDSPTYILSKPFVLLVFLGIVDNLMSKWDWKQALFMVLAILCATLAKPSFTITIIPALGILLILNIKKLKSVNWFYLIGPIGLTAFLVLLSQFIINYVGARGDRVIFAPFQSILIQVPNLFLLSLLILMSIVFPLLVTILHWKNIKNDLGFQLAWINFIIAAIYGLVFAEEINMGVNNFWNSPMIGVFVLFFVTIAYWGKDLIENIRSNRKLSGRQIVTSCVLGLHFICGIIYYVATLLNTGVIVN